MRRSIYLIAAFVLLSIVQTTSAQETFVRPIPVARQKRCILLVPTLCEAVHDKTVMALTAGEVVGMAADNVTTVEDVKIGFIEGDPISRFFYGERPTYARMIPIDAAYDVGMLYLSEKLKTSHNHLLRKVWWLPDVVQISVSGGAVGWNLNLRKDRLAQQAELTRAVAASE